MSKSKTAKKRRVDPLRSLPRLRHFGDPPPELKRSFDNAYRVLSLPSNRGRIFTKEEWQAFRRHRPDSLCSRLTDMIIAMQPASLVDRLAPPWQLRVRRNQLDNALLNIHWYRIASTDIKGQTIYHSPSKPSVQLFGGRWHRGYSTHSILRIFQRVGINTNGGRLTFGALLFGNGKAVDVEVDEERGGFWLWSRNSEGSWMHQSVITLTGNEGPEPGAYWVRTCFCPVKTVGKFAVAKTALHPSMTVSGVTAPLFDSFIWTERLQDELKKLHDIQPQIKPVTKRYL